MKTLLLIALSLALTYASLCEARGGFSSSGGRGGFSSAGRSVISSPVRPGYNRATTTTTSSVTRSYAGSSVTPTNLYYGSFGMGYGYNNGLITGMIIGNMMHPSGTVVYSGGGAYSNNALLYPNGQVVNGDGRVVGTYNGGVFTPITKGPVVAKPVPNDVVAENGATGSDFLVIFLYVVLLVFLIIFTTILIIV